MGTPTTDGMTGALSSVRIHNPFRQYQDVTFPAGTMVRSTNPRRRGPAPLKRAVTVTLRSVCDGHIDLWNDEKMGRGFICLPTVSWVGSAGYWMDVRITPEIAYPLTGSNLVLPVLSDYDRAHLDVEPGFGLGYDNRDT